jgi:hypothetical protein
MMYDGAPFALSQIKEASGARLHELPMALIMGRGSQEE